MINNLPNLILNVCIALVLQLITKRMFLQRKTKFSLMDGDVSNHILVSKVAVHAQESVERLEEQDVVARQPIIFDELAIDCSADTPALETLDIAQPY